MNSIGLRIDFRGLNRRINESVTIEEAFPEVYEFAFPSNNDYNETVELINDLWNKYPRKEFNGKSPEEADLTGPREDSLISDLFDETKKNINPNEYSSSEK